MTNASFAPSRPRSFLPLLVVGGAIGVVVALGLYGTKPVYVALLPAGLAVLLPTLFLKHFREYWFVIFLLLGQFSFSKNLNDGLTVIAKYKIDYASTAITFDITASDLALLMLIVIWANDYLFNGRQFRFPPVTWFAVGYLAISLLSMLVSPWPYLGSVEMWRQIKIFIVYLFAVNCLDSKSVLKLLAIVAVLILVTQAGMTAARFETGYLTPLTFGDTHQDADQIEQYLSVDRFDQGALVRAFGTLGSPGATVRLCMLVIPFALFLCVRNPMFKARLPFIGLTAFGLLSLILTFTRVYFILAAFQLCLSFLIMVRNRMLKREEAIVLVMLALVGLAAVSPKLYAQFTVREESQSVRFLQYEAAARMIVAHPYLGVGLNNSTGQKREYSKLTYVPYDPDTQFFTEATHNLYLNMASEIGILGTLLFVAFFAKVTLVAWRQSRVSTDPQVKWAANAFFVVFCTIGVNGFMDPLQEYSVLVMLWLYAGITLNLPRMAEAVELAPQRAVRRA